MGCGASAHSQGSKPLLAGVEQTAVSQEGQGSKPAPIAEDVGSVSDKKRKEVGQSTGAPPNGAGDDVTPGPDCSDEALTKVTAVSTEPADANGTAPVTAAGEERPEEGEAAQPQSPPQGRLLLAGSAGDLERSTTGTIPVFDPAVTPNSSTAMVTLLPAEAPGFVPRSRYTNQSDLSMASTSYDLTGRAPDSDDDDDELAALFTMAAWKRFYGYNKRKPQDLLTYFWRKYQPQDFSCFCISYRNQELLMTQYMVDNCLHGYFCRLEALGLSDGLFLQMYTLRDYELDQFRIVGLLVLQGQALPPPLSTLSAFDGFVYQRADTNNMTVRQFVSALLVGWSPVNSLTLLNWRELA